MNRKVALITVAMVALLTSSILVISQAGAFLTPKPQYVMYDFRTFQNSGTVTNEKVTGTTVVLDEYFPDTTIVSANVTVNGVTYYYPQDFDYNVTVHLEFDSVSGYGICTLYETLYFKNLPSGNDPCSTLIGMASEKASGMTSHNTAEFNGNFQLAGTGVFKDVSGSGIAMKGVSTNMYSWHIAWISGWPSIPGGDNVFGNSALGALLGTNDADAQSVSYFTSTNAGKITDIVAYIDGVTAGNCIAGLYAVSGGSAGALLEQSNPVSIGTSFSWVDFKLPTAYTVNSGTTYGLAIMGNVPVNVMETQGAGQRDHNAVGSYAAGFANPFGPVWGTDNAGAMSIYAAES